MLLASGTGTDKRPAPSHPLSSTLCGITDTQFVSPPLSRIESSDIKRRFAIHNGRPLEAIDWSAKLMRVNRCGVIDPAEPPILRKLELNELWSTRFPGAETRS